MAKELSFVDRFGREPTVLVRSPGRVNLIGEHTDYNLGYVLPAAIDRFTRLAVAPRGDHKLNIYSETMGDGVEIDLEGHMGLLGEATDWPNYVRGVVSWLREHDYSPVGSDVLIFGDLPVHSGLSSSASLLVGLLAALSSVAGWKIPKTELARAAQKVESEFLGIPTGIMDQMVIAAAEPRSALLIDCRSLNTTAVPLNLAAMGASLIVVNSGISPDLASSAAARRRRECEAAVGSLRVITYDLDLHSLRDVTPEMLHRHGSKLYPAMYKRARHVVTENQRVLEMVSALSENDAKTAGRLMNDSHASLSHDFEVSNPIIDHLVELAQQTEGVYGARLTGPGFGGCTVSLVQTSALRNFERNVVRRYGEETSLKAESFLVRPVGGVEVQNLGA